MKATFTPEQDSALRQLEQAIESHDHNAFGLTRRWQAARCVVHWFEEVRRLGVDDALTDSEKCCVRRCQTFTP